MSIKTATGPAGTVYTLQCDRVTGGQPCTQATEVKRPHKPSKPLTIEQLQKVLRYMGWSSTAKDSATIDFCCDCTYKASAVFNPAKHGQPR